MISNRFEMNMDMAYYKMHRESVEDTPDRNESYSNELAVALYGKNRVHEKILVLCKKPPCPPERYHEQLRRIHATTHTPIKQRVVRKEAVRILDASGIYDDYYTSIMDWNESSNKIAVALESNLYVWRDEIDHSPTLLIGNDDGDLPPLPIISSVAWCRDLEPCLVVGDQNGLIGVWDVEREMQVRRFVGHTDSVGCLDIHEFIVTSGSRDSLIINWDLRVPVARVMTYEGHQGGVDVVKWNHDRSTLASGGNDTNIHLWSSHNTTLPIEIESHTTTVKAIAWCPWQHNLMATGAGQSDGTIRLWNVDTYTLLDYVETKSQITSLLWSTRTRELISSHGYPTNSITVWRYPTMSPLVEWCHDKRVLSIALSPDGSTLLSAGADETLRFWQLRETSSTPRRQMMGSVIR